MTVVTEATRKDQKLSKAEQTYLWLRNKIRTREYEPGHRLVLSTLAQTLNVSVVPVREAIRQLEAEGLVTYEHNVGARVSTLNREAYFETMESIALLEGRATALSAPHLTDEDLAIARGYNMRMESLLNDFRPETFTSLNQKFHTALFHKCPNSRLKDLVYEEWDRLDYFRVSTFRYVPRRAESSVQEHCRLLALIEAHAAPDYIEQEARQHRMRTSQVYSEQLQHTAENPNTSNPFHEENS